MTLQTGDGDMRPGQRKITQIVIVACVAPRVGRMALRTSLREIAVHMIRILRIVVAFDVTVHALILCARVSACMTLRAGSRDVRTRQLELR